MKLAILSCSMKCYSTRRLRESAQQRGHEVKVLNTLKSAIIPQGSEYVGKSIHESGLRENDINVLTLNRGTTVIPNPRPDRQLTAGDRLLCFGKLDLMRDLVPAKTRRRRRPKVLDLPDLPVADEVHSDPSGPASS